MESSTVPVIQLDDHRYNVRAALREMLEDRALDDLDDHQLIERLIADLSPGEMRDALHTSLPDVLREIRHVAFYTTQRNVAAAASTPASPPRSRWNRVSPERVEEVRERVFGEWVMTATGRKRFGTCTADDVQWLADERFRQSEQALAWANRFARIHKAMRAAGAETVADLGDKAVVLLADV